MSEAKHTDFLLGKHACSCMKTEIIHRISNYFLLAFDLVCCLSLVSVLLFFDVCRWSDDLWQLTPLFQYTCWLNAVLLLPRMA
jgi:hypothetical protein